MVIVPRGVSHLTLLVLLLLSGIAFAAPGTPARPAEEVEPLFTYGAPGAAAPMTLNDIPGQEGKTLREEMVDPLVFREFDGLIDEYPTQCDGKRKKDCYIAYGSKVLRSEPICQKYRNGKLGPFAYCIAETEANYASAAMHAYNELREAVGIVNSQLPQTHWYAWNKEVQSHFTMQERSWATVERRFIGEMADSLRNRCVHAQYANKCLDAVERVVRYGEKHIAKGVVYDRAAHIRHTVWGAYNLSPNLRVYLPSEAAAKKKNDTGGSDGTQGKRARSGSLGVLKSCYNNIKGVAFSDDEISCAIEDSPLVPFEAELDNILSASTVLTYLDVLRMEAISAQLKSYRELTGIQGINIEKACKRFESGMREAMSPPVDKRMVDFYQSPAYRDIVKKAVPVAMQLVREAEELRKVPSRYDPYGAGQGPMMYGATDRMVSNPAYPPAQARLKEVEMELADMFSRLPVLSAGHDPKQPVSLELAMLNRLNGALKDDAAFAKAIDEGHGVVAKEIARSINRFCSEDEVKWDDLVTMQGLTGTVLQRFPQFKPFHDCALEKAIAAGATPTVFYIAMGVGCTLASIGPQALVVVPACSVATLGTATYEWLEAKRKVAAVAECHTPGTDQVCSGQDYVAAQNAYDDAVTNLVIAGAFAGLDSVMFAGQLKHAAKMVQAKRVAAATERLKKLSERSFFLKNGERLAIEQELAAALKLAEKEQFSAIEAVLSRAENTVKQAEKAAVDAYETLGSKLSGPDDEIARVLSEVYGMDADGKQTKILASLLKKRWAGKASPDDVLKRKTLLDELLKPCRSNPSECQDGAGVLVNKLVESGEGSGRSISAVRSEVGELAEKALGRKLTPRQKLDVGKASEYGIGDFYTAEQLKDQEALLAKAGLSRTEVTELRRVGILGNGRLMAPGEMPVKVAVRNTVVENLSGKHLSKLVKGKKYRYFIDQHDQLHIVDGELKLPRNELLVVRDVSKAKQPSYVVREAGILEIAEHGKKPVLRREYGIQPTPEEMESVLKQIKERDPTLGVEYAARTGDRAVTALSCAEVLASQMGGKRFILHNLLTSNVINLLAIGMRELATGGETIKTEKGRTILITGLLTGNVANLVGASLAKTLIVGNVSNSASYGARIALGATLTEAQGQVFRGVMGDSASDKKEAEALVNFDRAYFYGKIVVNQHVDKFFIEQLPGMLYDSCKKNGGLKFYMGPGFIRLYERFGSAIFYFGARQAVVGF